LDPTTIEYWKLRKINAQMILAFLDEIEYSSFCPTGLMEALRAINNTIYKNHGLQHFSKFILDPTYLAWASISLTRLHAMRNAQKLNDEFARSMKCKDFEEMIIEYSNKHTDANGEMNPNLKTFLQIGLGEDFYKSRS
jgi:hypothetical protein